MWKRTLILIMVIICYGLVVCNEDGKSYAGEKKYSKEVGLAITALKERWTEIYSKEVPPQVAPDGYFEIKNTRVISLKDDASNFLEPDGLRYVVEFVIFTDLYGTSPYYFITEHRNTVAIFKDGRTEVLPRNVFRYYFSTTYSNDFSKFIESVHDLNDEYNMVMNLGMH